MTGSSSTVLAAALLVVLELLLAGDGRFLLSEAGAAFSQERPAWGRFGGLALSVVLRFALVLGLLALGPRVQLGLGIVLVISAGSQLWRALRHEDPPEDQRRRHSFGTLALTLTLVGLDVGRSFELAVVGAWATGAWPVLVVGSLIGIGLRELAPAAVERLHGGRPWLLTIGRLTLVGVGGALVVRGLSA